MAGAQGETPRRDKGRAGAARREGSQPDEGKVGNGGSENQFYVCVSFVCVCLRGAVTRKPRSEVPGAGVLQ